MKTIYFFVLALIMTACHLSTEESVRVKPNVIYILADDLGYGDLQSLNPESKIPTPNMDQIVDQGMYFTDAHTNSAVCTPTRYGTLTGRYAFRTRLKKGVLWGYSAPLIDPGRKTVASLMKENGYSTACIGKWHLGLEWAKKDQDKTIEDIQWDDNVSVEFDDNVDYKSKVKGGPADHGFDYSLIIPASLDMSPYCYVSNGQVVDAPTMFTQGKSPDKDGRGVFWRPGKVSPGFDFDQVLPTFVDTAAQYIRQHAQQDNPFFLYLALSAPHTPWLPTAPYSGKSGADRYVDFVVMVDKMIGKVLQQVEEAGIKENTLIIVTSDNGSDWRPSDIEQTGHRANYIYKGRKADIYEAGHRVPYVAKWEGVIPAGHHSDQLLCSTDLMATLMGMLGESLPEDAGEDSYNLWPAFVGEVDSPIRESIIHHSLHGFFALRKDQWKFTPQLGSGGFTDPQTIVPKEGENPGTLYDLIKDPGEKNNLYGAHPEVVSHLSQLLETYKDQGYTRPGFNSKQ